MLGAAVGAMVMIGGVTLVTNRTRLSSDTAIGLLFVAMLALGVVIVSATGAFQGDLLAILFGQILGTSVEQLLVMAVATVVVVVSAVVASRPFLLLAFEPEQADVAGFSSRRYHTLMMLLVALTVVVAFQTVGTLLVFGMLLAPAATGALLASRISGMMVVARRRRLGEHLPRPAGELLVRRRGERHHRARRGGDLLHRLSPLTGRRAHGLGRVRTRAGGRWRGEATPVQATLAR